MNIKFHPEHYASVDDQAYEMACELVGPNSHEFDEVLERITEELEASRDDEQHELINTEIDAELGRLRQWAMAQVKFG